MYCELSFMRCNSCECESYTEFSTALYDPDRFASAATIDRPHSVVQRPHQRLSLDLRWNGLPDDNTNRSRPLAESFAAPIKS